MSIFPVFVNGQWRAADDVTTFHAADPRDGGELPDEFPVSSWQDCEAALDAAVAAGRQLGRGPSNWLPVFLGRLSARLEADAAKVSEIAERETGLSAEMLRTVELPRTVKQMRLAAAVVRDGSWVQAVTDVENKLVAQHVPLRQPVVVFGPCNFPLAFNAAAGGDFVAALAAGNPVLAITHHLHPRTSYLLAELAAAAAVDSDLPPGTFQMLYHLEPDDGVRLVLDKRVGAVAFTGSRSAGLTLKAAADRAGTPIYLEMSSINPGVILPGALRERMDDVVNEYVRSALMRNGQMCTNPGLTILMRGPESARFCETVAEKFSTAPLGALFSQGILEALERSVAGLTKAGAALRVGGCRRDAAGFRYENTLLVASGDDFLKAAEALQQEAFGNAVLLVIVQDVDQALAVVNRLDHNLAGFLYTSAGGDDNEAAQQLWPALAARVGRCIHNQMPTGVAVSPAMHHGGGYPATGHPGWTSVGMPASLLRFTRRVCFQNVGDDRLNLWNL